MGYGDIPHKFAKHLVGGSLTRAGVWVGDKAGRFAGDGILGQAVRSTVTDVATGATDQARSYMNDKIDNMGRRRDRRQSSQANGEDDYDSELNDPYASDEPQDIEEEPPRRLRDIPRKFAKHLVGGSLTRAGVWVGNKVGGLAGNALIGQAARSTVTDVTMDATEHARDYLNRKIDKMSAGRRRDGRQPSNATGGDEYELDLNDQDYSQEYPEYSDNQTGPSDQDYPHNDGYSKASMPRFAHEEYPIVPADTAPTRHWQQSITNKPTNPSNRGKPSPRR